MATLKCIRLGNLANDLDTGLAKYIYDYFKPIMVEHADPEELEKLREQFLLLCRKAFELRILMRGSLEGYGSIRLHGGVELASNENIADACAVFKGRDAEMGPEVDFTLFGALVKHPKYRGEGEVILEKAQVVMARQA